VTVAVRGMHFGRYGRDSENFQIVDLFVGYQELVRGYGLGSFDARDCADREAGGKCTVFNNLRGSRVAVANIEVRAPLPGLFRGEIEYWRVPVEIAGFFDAGLAWTRTSKPSFAGGTREVVRSAGAAVRVNLLGFVVLELSAAKPLNRPQHGWQWQLGIKQGF
jgi:outer membrane protein assembly factor BamA